MKNQAVSLQAAAACCSFDGLTLLRMTNLRFSEMKEQQQQTKKQQPAKTANERHQ